MRSLMPPSRALCVRIRCDAYSRVASLRASLRRPGLLLGPCCHDGISAKLIEQAGFPFTFMSGFTTSAAKLAAPDVGLLTYSEMVDRGRDVHEATRYIPVIGDGDTGYGNAMNVKRTVKGYAAAGFAGILIEDQEWPKSCGHVKGKKVVSRREAVQRIVAAAEAREESQDIIILARTDARQADSLEEALYRIQAFADVGADMLFIDALESVQEMEQFCALCPSIPKLANMLEGGGKTPILRPAHLEEIGFKLAAYPLSLLGVSIKAMQDALEGLRNGQVPDLNFQGLQDTLGFDTYFSQRDGYIEKAEAILENRDCRPSEAPEPDSGQGTNGASASTPVEADAVLTPEEAAAENAVVTVEAPPQEKEKWFPSIAEIRVTDLETKETKMEFKIPVGFLNEISQTIPALRDADLSSFVNRERFPEGQPAISFTDDGEIVEVFLL